MRIALVVAAGVALAVAHVSAQPPGADAGAARIKVERDGVNLFITGTSGPRRDAVQLGVDESGDDYVIEANRPIRAASCRPSDGAPTRVRCRAAGVDGIGVFLEGGPDRFKVTSRRVAAALVAFGGRGADRIIGAGVADDFFGGGAGRDALRGRGGNDKLRGANGRDDLRGGRGNDRLSGGPDNDDCAGGPGRDVERDC